MQLSPGEIDLLPNPAPSRRLIAGRARGACDQRKQAHVLFEEACFGQFEENRRHIYLKVQVKSYGALGLCGIGAWGAARETSHEGAAIVATAVDSLFSSRPTSQLLTRN